MLKKIIFGVSAALLLLVIAVVLYFEGFPVKQTVCTIDSVASINPDEWTAIAAVRSVGFRESLTLTYDSFPVPVYDKSQRQYLLCTNLIDKITVRFNSDCRLAKSADETGVTLFVWNDDSCWTYRIDGTTFPVLSVDASSKWLFKKSKEGFLTVFENDAEKATRFVVKIKTHGGSSLQYPKKSMTIDLLDSTDGSALQTSFLHMSENSEFILNSLYEDDSKIRDVFTLSLWENMESSSQEVPSGIDMEMTEVSLNGEYWGLYGLQENINSSSYFPDGTSAASIIKSSSYAIPSLAEYSPNSKQWGTVELEESSSNAPWACFEKFVAAISSSSPEEFNGGCLRYLNMDNCVDYYLWTDLFFATDNIWKNMVFVETGDGGDNARLNILPWDSDLSLGAVWDATAPRKVGFQLSKATTNLLDGGEGNFFDLLWNNNPDDFQIKAAKRWFELRRDVFSEQSLLQTADTAFDEITNSGARARDKLRWTESASCADNSFIDEFIQLRLAYLDEFYANVLSEAGS